MADEELTPVRRSKYATEEERLAAVRERKRLWAQKKRAETRAQQLASQGISSPRPAASPQSQSINSPRPANIAPKTTRSILEGGPITTGFQSLNKPSPVHNLSPQSPSPRYPLPRSNGRQIKAERPEPVVKAPLLFTGPIAKLPMLQAANSTLDSIVIPPKPTPHSQLHDPSMGSDPEDEILCIFLPGNPGLIGYYTHFLNELAAQLAWSDSLNTYTVFGTSHGGFNLSATDSTFASLRTKYLHVPALAGAADHSKQAELKVYTLAEQIQLKVDLITSIWHARPETKILLMGHSVGGYILLEVLRLLNEARSRGEVHSGEIAGGVLLFPTITHIAKSSNGRISTPLLKTFPRWPKVAQFFIKLWIAMMPAFLFAFLVRIFCPRFPKEAVKTTTSFLRSPIGVTQALSMAREEMLNIGDDNWDDEIWGSDETPASELIFYYGEKDQWVKNAERDELMKRRGRGGEKWVEEGFDEGQIKISPLKGKLAAKDDWKPRMMVCGDGLPHGFCISHSEVMATKTAKWVQDIVEGYHIKK